MNSYLRYATKNDVDLLFEWANESLVRKNSFSPEQISYDEHKIWFEKSLTRTDRKQYIYLYNNEEIGQIRIDVHDEIAEISYSICAPKRGVGHGKNLLRLLYKQVQIDFPNVKKLVAKVKPDNIASQQVFLDVGYTERFSQFELDILNVDMSEMDDIKESRGGVLFLTNNQNALGLYYWLRDRCVINLFSEKISIELVKELSPDMIICYNYNHIINNEVIDYMKGNIINLHISFLPWNRGSSPNIWSFIENSPKGVTIHQINAGLDKGKILFQKECHFNPENETFITTYDKLNKEIVELFKENWDDIYNGKYILKEQQGKGSYHSVQDLEKIRTKVNFEWSDNIAKFLQAYDAIKKAQNE